MNLFFVIKFMLIIFLLPTHLFASEPTTVDINSLAGNYRQEMKALWDGHEATTIIDPPTHRSSNALDLQFVILKQKELETGKLKILDRYNVFLNNEQFDLPRSLVKSQFIPNMFQSPITSIENKTFTLNLEILSNALPYNFNAQVCYATLDHNPELLSAQMGYSGTLCQFTREASFSFLFPNQVTFQSSETICLPESLYIRTWHSSMTSPQKFVLETSSNLTQEQQGEDVTISGLNIDFENLLELWNEHTDTPQQLTIVYDAKENTVAVKG